MCQNTKSEPNVTKVIFCDVDGPLIPGRMYCGGMPHWPTIGEPVWKYDPVAVKMLQYLCTKYEARIVYNTSHNDFGADYIKLQAACNIGKAYLHDDFMTQFPTQTYYRDRAVNRWLRDHPEITHWVVVDDYDVPLPNFVKINFAVGISHDDFMKMERMLKDHGREELA